MTKELIVGNELKKERISEVLVGFDRIVALDYRAEEKTR
jgi:hypothetical protein